MGYCTGITKRELAILLALACANFSRTLTLSLQAPFFPKEAEKKGATAFEYGFVFGVYDLVVFLTSPIFGKYMDKIGAKATIVGGLFTTGVSTLLFGTLACVDSHGWFIALSFLFRILEALGGAAAGTASVSITMSVFRDAIGINLAGLEVAYGIGYMSGPTIGGYLFEFGGFAVPFSFVGSLSLLIGIFFIIALPGGKNDKDDTTTTGRIMSILTVTPVMLMMYSIIAHTISMGFCAAILEPHLRQFHLSPVVTGSVFIISGTTYTVTAPLVGRLCDTWLNPRKTVIVGSVLVIISYLLLGPVPFTRFKTTLWVVCIGLVVQGLGYSCVFVPAMLDGIRSAEAHGLPDDINTHGPVSGLISSAFSLGGFIGASVAGFLFHKVGFQKGSLFVIVVHGILFLSMTCFVCANPQPQRQLDQDSAQSTEEKEKSLLEEEKLHLVTGEKIKKST